MAAIEYKLFLDKDKKTLSLSETVAVPFTFPVQKSGDGINFRLGVVAQDPASGRGRTSRVTISGLTCKVAVGSREGTPLTSVTITTIEDNYFVGLLPLNVAAIDALFDTPNENKVSEQRIEFELNDGTSVYSVEFPFNIVGQLATTTLTDTPAPDTAIGKNEANAIYLKKGENNPGEGMILVSPDGTRKAYIYLDNQGQLQTSPIT